MISGQIMGHVKDTPRVRAVEDKYNIKLEGYSARWTDDTDGWKRVEVFDGEWRGIYILQLEDLEVYPCS